MRFKTKLDVNLSVLESNYQLLQKMIKGNEVIFMVKANGYGHGLLPITDFAVNELSIKEVGVASLGEALELRNQLPGSKFELLVFSELGLDDEEKRELYLNRGILPVISSLSELRIFLEDQSFKNLPLILHFNTGMNRLGIELGELEQAVAIIRKSGRTSIYHLMTHFGCASNSMKTNSHNKRQLENWESVKSGVKASGLDVERTSISNSGALEQGVGLDESHVRPGLMLYGPTSLIPPLRSESLWHGKNISSFRAEVLKVFSVERGQPIGYGATPCPDKGWVVIIGIGYGDGFSTFYSGAHLGKGRIHGRVNMDMTQIFYREKPTYQKGDLFEIWNNDLSSIMNFSDETKVIPYELFCGLTDRVPRTYSKA